MKKALADSILNIAEHDDRIVFLTADLGFMVLEPIKKLLGERYINVGIAEQNMIGIAAGLASQGFIPFVYTMAQFIALRCLEHIRVSLIQNDRKAILIGIGAGFTYGIQGPSHHSIEDIGAMTLLPNLNVISPADKFDVNGAVMSAIEADKSSYIRLGNLGKKAIKDQNRTFRIGQMQQIANGDTIALISHGEAVSLCLDIVEILKNRFGLQISLYNSPSLKPFDSQSALRILERYKIVFTIEESIKNGGLGSIVSELIAAKRTDRLIFRTFSLKDEYKKVCGDSDYLKAMDGLNIKNILGILIKDAEEVGFANK
jgi:transketolase